MGLARGRAHALEMMPDGAECGRRAGGRTEAPADGRTRTAEGALTGRADRRELAAIFAGGVLGALARGALAETAVAGDWPWTTFAAIVGGALMLGYFSTRLQERLPLSSYRRPPLGTGLCGALTTFSTMPVELAEDARRGPVP
jgi:fluoride exporter